MKTQRMAIGCAVVALAASSFAVEDKLYASPPIDPRIEPAVQRAVEYLRKSQRPDGSWPHPSARETDDVALTSLVAMALLSAGTERSDPGIVKAGRFVRDRFENANRREWSTVTLAAGILIMDRLYEDADEVIKLAALRLSAAQNQTTGTWRRDAPPLNGEQLAQWADIVQARHGKAMLKKSGRERIRLERRGENLETQFAIFALWVAHRHGVSADYAMRLAGEHFRRTQQADGGWREAHGKVGPDRSTPLATCMGLLGLAFGYSSSKEHAVKYSWGNNIWDNPAYKRAVRRLAAFIDHERQPNQIRHLNCFLWLTERVSTVYGFEKGIEGRDWFGVGATALLTTQQKDGSWPGDSEFDSIANTTFGVLFLHEGFTTKYPRSTGARGR